MTNQVAKLNPEWISATRQDFLDFLELTKFPHPVRDGTRGSRFDYPEWKISVHCCFSSQVSRENLFGNLSDDQKVLETNCRGTWFVSYFRVSTTGTLKKNLPRA